MGTVGRGVALTRLQLVPSQHRPSRLDPLAEQGLGHHARGAGAPRRGLGDGAEALMPISNVSDTARWVAVYRAMETARPDAIFRDPYAERLAGERGLEIVRELPSGRALAWPMIVRTAVFDEIILGAVQRGADL